MKSLTEHLMTASKMSLNYRDWERLSDDTLRLFFAPFSFTLADAQIVEDRFGDSLLNFRCEPLDATSVDLRVIVTYYE